MRIGKKKEFVKIQQKSMIMVKILKVFGKGQKEEKSKKN